MSGAFMLDEIIINLFSDTTKQKMNSVGNNFKIKDDKIYLY